MVHRHLPEKVGQLFVGGYPQAFSTLDLKVKLLALLWLSMVLIAL